MSEADSMTLDEAVTVAQRIRVDHSEITVRAVGRFVSPEELRTLPERWGVSVLLASGKTMVIWSSLSLSMIAPVNAKRESKAAKGESRRAKGESRRAKRESIDERQEVLF